MIKFDLLGADFSPRAEKLEPWLYVVVMEWAGTFLILWEYG